MDNQHRQIKGYRELSQQEIEVMNRVKRVAAEVEKLVSSLQADTTTDPRWVSIGTTDLQKGFMALTRAIAKPDSF
jgi:hypothetical protein